MNTIIIKAYNRNKYPKTKYNLKPINRWNFLMKIIIK